MIIIIIVLECRYITDARLCNERSHFRSAIKGTLEMNGDHNTFKCCSNESSDPLKRGGAARGLFCVRLMCQGTPSGDGAENAGDCTYSPTP